MEQHVTTMGEYLYDRLAALRHSNGNPVVRVFGKHHLPNRQARRPRAGTDTHLARQAMRFCSAHKLAAGCRMCIGLGCQCRTVS